MSEIKSGGKLVNVKATRKGFVVVGKLEPFPSLNHAISYVQTWGEPDTPYVVYNNDMTKVEMVILNGELFDSVR